MLFRYAIKPGGVTFDVYHRCPVQRVQPAHDQPVIVPPDKIGDREPDRVWPMRLTGGKHPVFDTGMRGCGGKSRAIGPVKPVEHDEMFLAFHVLEAGHIRFIDLNDRLCIRKPALPGRIFWYFEW